MIKAIINKIKWFYYILDNDRYVKYLRSMGVRIGENFMVWTKSRFSIDLTRPWLIEIGNNVEITAGVTILTHGYDWCVIHHKTGEILGSAGKVTIGNNVFIGTQATILAGTTIGDNVIIGADSLVKGVIESNSVYAGNPARKISTLDRYIEKRRKRQLEEAVQLAIEHKIVYQKYPDIESMNEFFWLFEDKLENLNDTFKNKLNLRGNYPQSSVAFEIHEKMFENYEDFLNYCDTIYHKDINS